MVRSHGFSLKFPMFVNQHTLKLQEAILLVKRQTVEQNAEQETKLELSSVDTLSSLCNTIYVTALRQHYQ